MRCTEAGCGSSAVGPTKLCIKHGGGVRCTESECAKSAIGSTKFCKKHGGGVRCTEAGCGNSAVGPTKLCKKHGGGRRCIEISCSSSAIGSTKFCKKHGGGRRCKYPECTISARNPAEFCIAHFGGIRCEYPDCNSSARAPTKFCKTHGGGRRCQDTCCSSWDEPTVASFKHPDSGLYICTSNARFLVQQALEDKNNDRVLFLQKYFGFKKDLVMRGEHAFYHELNKLVPELRLSERVLDESILSKTIGKQKSVGDLRPDYFHFFSDGKVNMALHGEYDETVNHENCLDRLKICEKVAQCEGTTYVFRVCGRHGDENALCKKFTINKSFTYYGLTDEGRRVLKEEVVPLVKQQLDWIKEGLAPNDKEGRPYMTMIHF